ncbi:hypothetical protein KQH54_02610 [bacterium]|nr:hypothetical protein [bacterium]
MENIQITAIKNYLKTIFKNWHNEEACYPIPDWFKRFRSPTLEPIETITEVKLLISEWLAHHESEAPDTNQILRQHYVKNHTIREIAQQWNYSVDQINRIQRRSLDQLAAYIVTQLQRQSDEDYHQILEQIPYPDQPALFGPLSRIDEIAQLLSSPSAPRIITLIGLGGIGKTSLANAAVKATAQDVAFPLFAWVNMDKFPELSTIEEISSEIVQKIAQKMFSNTLSAMDKLDQTKRALKKYPCLVILDGIPEEIELSQIVQAISPWANPSKFLLTSRNTGHNPEEYYTVQLHELEPEETIRLFNYQVDISGIRKFEPFTETDQQNIYQTVGGNPLAIKLIVGLLEIFPLDFILKDMQNCHINSVQEMYEYIYLKAWYALNRNAQSLLLSMPLVSEDGGEIDQIQSITGLSSKSTINAIHFLHQRSLLEALGDARGRRYRIHHLTRSFLHTHIIQWPPQ